MTAPTPLSVSRPFGPVVGTFYGGGSQVPLVLVHGLTSASESWDPLLDRLSRDRPVLVVDLRGHGASAWASWEKDGYTAAAMATDVAELCREAGLTETVVIGHSLGARVALRMAAGSSSVLGVALSDTFPVLGPEGAAWAQREVTPRFSQTFRTTQEATAWLREDNPQWSDEWYEALTRTFFRENWAGKTVFRCDPQLAWLLSGSASRREAEANRKAAGDVRQPCLLMWGRTSELVSEADLRSSAELFRRPEVEVFETGHYIMREDEAAWVDRVELLCRDLTA